MSREARGRSFDELATGLASGDMSRREVLRWLGAALLGGALAFTPKVAEAAGGCPAGQRACGRNEFRQPICYDTDVFFCCKTHTIFGTDARICDRRVFSQCCITANAANCQNVGDPCSGRVVTHVH